MPITLASTHPRLPIVPPATTMGGRWRFTVLAPHADRVYVVIDPHDGPSAWIEMARADRAGTWTIEADLTPGLRHRFRYYLAQGTTVLNGGDVGLEATPLTTYTPPPFARSA